MTTNHQRSCFRTLAILTTGFMAASFAHAQERNLTLAPGFMPDPMQRSYISGGGQEANGIFGTDMRGIACSGSISQTPDHVMTLTDGFDFLKVWNQSAADTTLIIDGPGRFLLCDDDGGEGLNELIEHSNWVPGEYRIYVGSYGGGVHNYELFVSELPGSGTPGSSSGYADTSEERHLAITPGFSPDPWRVSFISGGVQSASTQFGTDMLGNSCQGNVAATPDHEMTLLDTFSYLQLWTQADGDTTLIVDGPGKFLLCDDDGGSGLNEHIEYTSWPAGDYRIYVGSYSEDYLNYQLSVSELRSEGPNR